LGRISQNPPRFGGHFSNILKNLSTNDIEIIKSTIIDIVKDGYNAHLQIELLTNSLKIPGINSFDSLFKQLNVLMRL